MPLRCLLVDDSDAFLETASLLLEREGLKVAGVASSIAEALQQARTLRPDVILVDIGLGNESGFTLARLLARDDHGAIVILISAETEADYAELIAESPAAGFLAKSELSVRRIGRILGRALASIHQSSRGVVPACPGIAWVLSPASRADARYS
jgi:CheY-like chemotaxis protein